MVLRNCCFCVDLRNGAVAIAVLHILGALANLGYGIQTVSWMLILDFLVGIAAGVCLLYGAIKYNAIATVIHLVLALIEIIFLFVIAILILVGFASWLHLDGGELSWWHILTLIIAVTIIVWALVEIYFCVCVYSFYKQLKSGIITSTA